MGAADRTGQKARRAANREERARHWDAAYARLGAEGVSWYQETPSASLELIDLLGVGRDEAVVDVGGGASGLAGELVGRGFADVSVLDVSAASLTAGRRRAGDAAASVRWLHEDVLRWRPERRFGLWHDRAVFHFLVAAAERERYLRALHAALRAGGSVILATFAADGPEFCSGLPVARYSHGGLAELLGPGFELLAARREEHITPGGVMQPFTWMAGQIHSVAPSTGRRASERA